MRRMLPIRGHYKGDSLRSIYSLRERLVGTTRRRDGVRPEEGEASLPGRVVPGGRQGAAPDAGLPRPGRHGRRGHRRSRGRPALVRAAQARRGGGEAVPRLAGGGEAGSARRPQEGALVLARVAAAQERHAFWALEETRRRA